MAPQFEELEEGCIPSYTHRNLGAAWVAWQRLLTAAVMYEDWAPDGDILDFGSATGEIRHLVKARGAYWFVERSDILALALQETFLDAKRIDLDKHQERQFAAVFALDSLEHNKNVPEILDKLIRIMRADGVLILSGPTENVIYKIGRYFAGFHGHYHHHTIFDIEKHVSRRMVLIRRRLVPLGIPLFALSAWCLGNG